MELRRGATGLVAWQLVVRAPLERVLGDVRGAMARHGYRLTSAPGALPLVFARGSVASYALAQVRLARYSVVRVEARLLDTTVELGMVQVRAQHAPEAAAVLRAVVDDLADGWTRSAELVSVTPREHTDRPVPRGPRGYRGGRRDGGPRPPAVPGRPGATT